jgi:translocator protein
MRSQRASAIGLIVFLTICYLRFEIGKKVTATTVGTWYQALHKASFNPPDSVFAPAWIILYFLMAVAGWRVWRHGSSREERYALVLFAVQLALNLVWSVLFFGFQRIDLALAEMLVLLLIVTSTTMLFWRIDRLAGILLAPYVLWLGFATVLTSFIWILN